ncbi:MAG: hypothetical protein AAF957_01360 [Planctomycetota bacterium]
MVDAAPIVVRHRNHRLKGVVLVLLLASTIAFLGIVAGANGGTVPMTGLWFLDGLATAAVVATLLVTLVWRAMMLRSDGRLLEITDEHLTFFGGVSARRQEPVELPWEEVEALAITLPGPDAPYGALRFTTRSGAVHRATTDQLDVSYEHLAALVEGRGVTIEV